MRIGDHQRIPFYLVGATGAGKTTLLHHLAEKEPPAAPQQSIGLEMQSIRLNSNHQQQQYIFFEIGSYASTESAMISSLHFNDQTVIALCISADDPTPEKTMTRYLTLLQAKSLLAEQVFVVLTKTDLLSEDALTQQQDRLQRHYPQHSLLCYNKTVESATTIRQQLCDRACTLKRYSDEIHSVPTGTGYTPLQIFINDGRQALIKHHDKSTPDYENFLQQLTAYRIQTIRIVAGADYTPVQKALGDHRHPCVYNKREQGLLLEFLLKLVRLKPTLSEIKLPFSPEHQLKSCHKATWQNIQTQLTTANRHCMYYQESQQMRVFRPHITPEARPDFEIIGEQSETQHKTLFFRPL